jgi:hypothetical protein
MEEGDIIMVIDGVLQEGTCSLGAVPGDCKTLVALSMAKAISTGKSLFGLPQFSVKEARSVVYLIPESRDRAFRKRCEKFRLPHDKMKFMSRTISMGLPLDLQDPYLLEACRQLHPVVFLDTAIRFTKSDNLNDAAKNQMLFKDVMTLLAAGAVTVVLLLHATKASRKETMDLQNMLAGTGDFAAMCDQAYGLQVDTKLYDFKRGPLEVTMVNLKDREEEGTLTKVRLAASHKVEGIALPVSYINQTGDFHVVDKMVEFQNSVEKLLSLIRTWPDYTLEELSEETGMTQANIRRLLTERGWHAVPGGKQGRSPWHQDGDKPCPYLKPETKTVQDAVSFLEGMMVLGPVPEADILMAADRVGLGDALLAKARKRLGLVSRDGVWALPGPEAASEAVAEEPEPNRGGRPKDKHPMTSTERSRAARARKREEGSDATATETDDTVKRSSPY